MARDASGNYSLPTGNPVQAGTVIESDWANDTMDDIATALTDSLSRTGNGGMLVPFKNSDGAVGTPGISWTNEPTSGWYRAGLNDFRYSVGNEDIFTITKDGIELVAGKTSVGFDVEPVTIDDDEPATPAAGDLWYESDSGGLYVYYENPDATFTWILVNSVGGDWFPASGLDLTLVDAVDDTGAAANGVAVGEVYRTGNFLKVRIT